MLHYIKSPVDVTVPYSEKYIKKENSYPLLKSGKIILFDAITVELRN